MSSLKDMLCVSHFKDHIIWLSSVVSNDFWQLEHTREFTSKAEVGQTVSNVE